MDVRNYVPATIQLRRAALVQASMYDRDGGVCNTNVEHFVRVFLGRDGLITKAVGSDAADEMMRKLSDAMRAKFKRDGLPKMNRGGRKFTSGAGWIINRAEVIAAEQGRPGRVFPVDILAALFESQAPMALFLLDDTLAIDRDAVLEQARAASAKELAAVS